MRAPALVLTVAIAMLGCTSGAGAVGLPNGYPRTIAGIGVADGVSVSRTQATMRVLSDNRVLVTVYAGATTNASGRRLVIAVARCTGSASSPTCAPTVSSRRSLNKGRTTLQGTYTIPRPAAKPN